MYNLKQLESIASGDKEFVREMLDIFIKVTPEDLAKIQDAIDAKNYESISKLSHKLVSSYNLINYKNVFLIKKLEEMGKNSEPIETITPVFERLNSETRNIIHDMNKDLP
ncbi:Hpt domain-containing protein [Psychroflexus sp. YR1-1]|uniref:Hpt domain-containing protein n=1 Tax=Psychroflexus aurantiacus TaxID=2709310 RepID=A0A6B3R2L5_9FLAO|nr:Hpt domain-containing protein [Psychroflexus aurantiacus]NEV94532.1 Hpt domain-containing protein [Psychroflexus aurantiacus]